ncbi:MAG TPA: P1 family peptidase [Longimicrobiales bacterium]|nr:P1 family peptidase [Longimicrobiales bacterium]
MKLLIASMLLFGVTAPSLAQRPTAVELGIPTTWPRGASNAITDVAGVEVGYTTLISGSGPLRVGEGPVRTGVTAILPRGRAAGDTVFAGWFSLNGNGEMTGTTWIEQSGRMEGPMAITNTHSVGVVRDAVIEWMAEHRPDFLFALPVVAETYDGTLSDINGMHVQREHVFSALDSAHGGPIAQGNVGGGTGMMCFGLKGGTGTASRVVPETVGGYTVGVLVQCNFGNRLRFAPLGVPVGRELPTTLRPCRAPGVQPTRQQFAGLPECAAADDDARDVQILPEGAGSIIIVIATDAPLLPHQLKRVATRASIAVGRVGGLGETSSGDIFLAFSTANRSALASADNVSSYESISDELLNPIYAAAVEATEEAILNAMLAAETMTGADGFRIHALPSDFLIETLRKYGRM